MRRNNKPGRARNHERKRSPLPSLTLSSGHQQAPDIVAMASACSFVRPARLRCLNSPRNAITAVGITWAPSPNERRVENQPHDAAKCLMAAAMMPPESPPPPLSPWHGLLPALGGRTSQVEMLLVHAWCYGFVRELCNLGIFGNS